MTHSKKGFTLIELLIVIGILAVLATLTVLVLNPAELFKQARDSQRMADLDTVRDGIIYVQGTATVATPLGTTAFWTGAPLLATTFACNAGATNIYTTTCGGNQVRTTGDGLGWVGFDFDGGGTVSPVPLAQLPLDPSNGATLFYTYKATAGLFRLGTILESAKYLPQMTADGGSATGMYEVGTGLSASPL